MSDHQAKARAILTVWKVCQSRDEIERIGICIATELRDALDRETALRAEVDRLREKMRQPKTWANAPHCSTCDCQEPQAFAGRRTGRNDPSIPTDAGVPRPTEAEIREQFDAECGGTIERIDIIGANGPAEWPENDDRLHVISQNGPTGDHYRAIGQPSKGDA